MISVLDVINTAFIKEMFLQKVTNPISSKLKENLGSEPPQLH